QSHSILYSTDCDSVCSGQPQQMVDLQQRVCQVCPPGDAHGGAHRPVLPRSVQSNSTREHVLFK
ncbi:hypothetical protein BgiBS90_009839, partial [Biomphalaria glabrata]